MVLKLYMDYISQPSRAILAFLLINKIPHEVVETRIIEGKQRTPEYTKINPFKKVPAIQEDDGFTLFESHAILRYLSKKYNVPDNWYSSDPRKMALIDRYLDWHHSYLRQGASTVVFYTLFAPRLGISKHVDLNEARKLLEFSLKSIDSIFLENSKFIAGDEISIADISCACEITQILLVGTDLSQYKNISAWLKRILSVKEVEQVHGPFFKVLKKFNPEPKF